jgi:predicted  nucleic acid-binding Zn-ribbon protein
MMPSLKQARRDVREGLAALPAPKFAYDVDVPDAVPEDAPVEMELEPDARAVDEARAEALRQQELAKLARRSSTVVILRKR